jgi:hypothetical protein
LGPFASLPSAVAEGVPLAGCSQQSNANIRPFAIALHCYFPSLDNLQLRFEFLRHSIVPDPHINVKIALAELPS